MKPEVSYSDGLDRPSLLFCGFTFVVKEKKEDRLASNKGKDSNYPFEYRRKIMRVTTTYSLTNLA